MEFKNLVLSEADGIGLIEINRPEARNALDGNTWRELDVAVNMYAATETVRVIIITGRGDKSFAAGADVGSLLQRTPIETLAGDNQRILSRIESVPKVTIAAVNGYALGGGCELAMAADIRIASTNARFGQPELGLGIIPGAGGTQRLVRLVGLGRAKELVLTGRIIDAEEARQIGLVSRVVPPDQLMDAAVELGKSLIRKGPLAVSLAKEVLHVAASSDFETGLAAERLAQSFLFTTWDHNEGLTAFLEKREPKFEGI